MDTADTGEFCLEVQWLLSFLAARREKTREQWSPLGLLDSLFLFSNSPSLESLPQARWC